MKRLAYIFIPILAILLMSHNANALNFGNAIELPYNIANSGLVWYGVTSDAAADAWHTNLGSNTGNGSIAFNSGVNTQINYVSRVVISLHSATGGKSLVNIPYRICFNNPSDMIAWIGFSGNGYTSVVSNNSQYTAGGCISGDVLVYLPYSVWNIYLGGGSGGVIIGSMPNNDGFTLVLGRATMISLSDDADYSSVLNAIKDNTDDIKSKLDEIADSADAALDREQSETQDAADDSSTAGSSSSSDATAATSSLISVIGGFVSVVTSATPTNCLIDADLNHIDMGNIDLCANPVPSYIQIIGSIILICAVIPLAIILFNRFIGLFRSFQG